MAEEPKQVGCLGQIGCHKPPLDITKYCTCRNCSNILTITLQCNFIYVDVAVVSGMLRVTYDVTSEHYTVRLFMF